MPKFKQVFLPGVPLEKLELWDKNFRNIKPESFERLKNKIKELGVFKPLLACAGPCGQICGYRRKSAPKSVSGAGIFFR
jgi:hypothetical protein